MRLPVISWVIELTGTALWIQSCGESSGQTTARVREFHQLGR